MEETNEMDVDNDINDEITSHEENALMNFICEECSKSFKYRRNLKRHFVSLHPNKVFYKEKTAKHVCSSCNMSFHKFYLLKKHKAREHPTMNKLHKCSICVLQFTKENLLLHFEKEHGIKMSEKKLVFPNLDDFFNWKEDMEKSTYSIFTKSRGLITSKTGTYHYFQCHRSGYYEARGARKRKIKKQGSSKINSCCPASIKMFESSEGTCTAYFINKHVGHRNELSHLIRSKKKKERIGAAEQYNFNENIASSFRPITETNNLTFDETDSLVKYVSSNESAMPLSQQREKLREYCNNIIDSLVTAEQLNFARTKISSIVNALRCNSKVHVSDFQTKSNAPANKHLERQQCFFSKRKNSKSRKNISVKERSFISKRKNSKSQKNISVKERSFISKRKNSKSQKNISVPSPDEYGTLVINLLSENTNSASE